VVESRFSLAHGRIDENEILPAVAQIVAIPEALGAAPSASTFVRNTLPPVMPPILSKRS
jgi:hypothetical protein